MRRTPGPKALTTILTLSLFAGCTPVVPIIGALGVTTVGAAEERSAKAQFSDIETESTINAQLLNYSPELFRRANVDVVEGRVLLSGTVARQEHSAKAEEIAAQAAGAREVINELTIETDKDFGTYSSDIWITTQLRSRLVARKEIMSVNYNIETHKGVVHLHGLARSDAELASVVEIASKVPGVKQVVSHVLAVDDPRRQRV